MRNLKQRLRTLGYESHAKLSGRVDSLGGRNNDGRFMADFPSVRLAELLEQTGTNAALLYMTYIV